MKQTNEDIIPIKTGEVFLQDKVLDDSCCYVCKKEFDKSKANDMLLIRIRGKEMGFCCDKHRGVVHEFIKQYRTLPMGWNKYEQTD